MADLNEVAGVLRAGGVALLPTDTVYGLAASAKHSQAVQNIFTLKSRSANKNLPIFVAGIEGLKALGIALTPRIETLLQTQWIPGALTLVLKVDPAKAPHWLEGRAEIAVRIPDDSFLRDVLAKTGPLLVTSANKSGEDTPALVGDVLAQLSGTPDITVDDGPRSGAPSTLIDCQFSPFKVQRRGALSKLAIEEILAI